MSENNKDNPKDLGFKGKKPIKKFKHFKQVLKEILEDEDIDNEIKEILSGGADEIGNEPGGLEDQIID